MNERKFSPPAVGGSSLLISFAVLCFTIFALLALETVEAGGRLSDVSAEAVSAYYEADCAAEEILMQLRAGTMPKGVMLDRTAEGDLFTYSCPISDTQTLQVEVEFRSDSYVIRRWQAVPASNWEADESIELWDGDPVVDLG